MILLCTNKLMSDSNFRQARGHVCVTWESQTTEPLLIAALIHNSNLQANLLSGALHSTITTCLQKVLSTTFVSYSIGMDSGSPDHIMQLWLWHGHPKPIHMHIQ